MKREETNGSGVVDSNKINAASSNYGVWASLSMLCVHQGHFRVIWEADEVIQHSSSFHFPNHPYLYTTPQHSQWLLFLDCLILKMKILQSFTALESIHPDTQCVFVDNLNL